MKNELQVRTATSLAGLAQLIADRTATVAVVGLGYVGLPLLTGAAASGFPVIGYDTDELKVQSLRAGRSYIVDISDAELVVLDRPRFTADRALLREADIIIVAVPTPLTDGVPNVGIVESAMRDVAWSLTPGKLVVLESTTYPGTTEEVVLPILESSGLKVSTDFALAYSPERIDPGSSWNIRDVPKIVSGVSDVDTALAVCFYACLVDKVVTTPTPRDAEMAKLIENTFRHVNIALVNELATLAPDLGVDIWSALEAAATKPFGYMPFWPGPGVGGHCIAIDPSYLSWRVGQRLGFGIGFIEHAKEVNNRMPRYVAARIGEALNDASKPLRGSRILAIGVAYKPAVNDVRESPALAVLEHLATKGVRCSYHDPYVPSIWLGGAELRSVALSPAVLAAQDCVTILTSHPGIDYAEVIAASPLVFDARGVTRGSTAPNVVRL